MRYAAILIFLSACATQKPSHWERPGANASDFEMDRGQCQAQAFGSSPAMNTMQIALVYNGCMRGKGWSLVEG